MEQWMLYEDEAIKETTLEKAYSTPSNDPEKAFIAMFGITDRLWYERYGEQPFLYSSAMYKIESEGASVGKAEVVDNYLDEAERRASFVSLHNIIPTAEMAQVGAALVREHK